MKTMTFILLLSLAFICSASELAVHSENDEKDSSLSEGSSKMMCPTGWQPFGDRCFKFIGIARTWAEAESYCLLEGGNLASMHSLSDHFFIQGLIMTHTQAPTVTWIGGSDAQQNGVWFWSDGSRFSFVNWSTGQPNSNQASENCLSTNHAGDLRWNDVPCSSLLPSVCARKLS